MLLGGAFRTIAYQALLPSSRLPYSGVFGPLAGSEGQGTPFLPLVGYVGFSLTGSAMESQSKFPTFYNPVPVALSPEELEELVSRAVADYNPHLVMTEEQLARCGPAFALMTGMAGLMEEGFDVGEAVAHRTVEFNPNFDG